jgi:hypothetical protein
MDDYGFEELLEAHRYHTVMEAARVAEDMPLDRFLELLEDHCRDPHTAHAFNRMKFILRSNPNEFYKNTY